MTVFYMPNIRHLYALFLVNDHNNLRYQQARQHDAEDGQPLL